MRRRTAFSAWDALGYLVWGYGWPVLDRVEEPAQSRTSDRGGLRIGHRCRQAVQERIRPRPRGPVVCPDRAMARGLDPQR